MCGSAAGLSAQKAASDSQPKTAAAPVTDFAAVRAIKVYHTTRTAGRLVIDGALDEQAWTEAEIGSGFYQTDPRNGYPASEETTFRILYDDDAIYIGVTAIQK